MIPESHRDLLDKKGFAHVATIGPDGKPQSSPVWYHWDGSHLRFSLTETRQKLHNLKRNPSVAISITDPDDPYRYIEIRGTVTAIDNDPSNTFIDSLAKKYLDQDAYPYHQPGDKRVVVSVAPEHTTQMG